MGFSDQLRQQSGVQPIQPSISTGTSSFSDRLRQRKLIAPVKPPAGEQKYQTRMTYSDAKAAEAPYVAEAKKANSFGGMLGSWGREMVNTVSAIPALGKTLGGMLAVPAVSDQYTKINQQNENNKIQLSRAIRAKESTGQDPTQLKKMFNQVVDLGQNTRQEYQDIAAPVQKTNKQVLGEIGQVGLEALSMGSYGLAANAGSRAFQLAPKFKSLPTAAQAAIRATREPVSLFTKQGGVRVAQGAGLGYGYDVTNNMRNNEEGVGMFKPGMGTLLGGAFPAGIGAVKATQNRLDPVLRRDRTISKTEQSLYNIENNYVKLRNNNNFKVDAGAASRKRIAESEALIGSVDKTGTITTKTPGGAIDKYKAQTIDGAENVVRNNLERLDESVNLSLVESKLLSSINDSGLVGDDLVKALNKVKKEIKGYAVKADANGNIKLKDLHDAKIGTTKQINYLTPPEKSAYRKSIARGLKEIIEDNSSFNVREVNEKIGEYLDDVTRLENLDGRKVRGGKLSKYFSQISGNIVGGSLGSALGPVGAGIGAIVGGEVTSGLRGRAMQNTFGKAFGSRLKKSDILEEAIKESKKPLPTKPILMLPPGNGRTPDSQVIRVLPSNSSVDSYFGEGLMAGKYTPPKTIYSNSLGSRKTIYKTPRTTNKNVSISSILPRPDRSVKSGKVPLLAKDRQVNPLAVEARKYKTADEFVKKQPIVYHGSQSPFTKFDNKQGTFFTDDMMNADGYAGGENVYEGYLNLKNPLVIDAKGKLHRELDTPYGKTTQEIVGKVDKSKYDGVIFKNIKDSWIDDADVDTPSTIYYAFKPKDAFLNESQLTDIWKQSQAKTPLLAKPNETLAKYSFERRRLQAKIVDDIYDAGSYTGKDKLGHDVFGGKIVKGKRIDLIVGPPAAGKSEVLANPFSKRFGSIIADADRVKVQLPEYNGGSGAARVHNESSDVVEVSLLNKLFENDVNIVLPLVAKSPGKITAIKNMAAKYGYDIHSHLNDLPPDKALARAEARATKTGREVPGDYITKEVGSKPKENFYKEAIGDPGMSEATVYSNDVGRGKGLDLVDTNQASYVFASPNTKVGLTYDDAIKQLSTKEHKAAKAKFMKIDEEMGLPPGTHSGAGAWSDGAENTFFYADGKISKDEIMYNAARKGVGDGGAKGAQKQVIYFREGKEGSDFIYEIKFKGVEPKKVYEMLRKNGVEYQTVANDRVIIFNKSGDFFDSTMLDKLDKTGKELGNNFDGITTKQGEGDFIGSWLEDDLPARQEALKVYNEIIANYKKKYD
jgi:predicted ABC-type ATPase